MRHPTPRAALACAAALLCAACGSSSHGPGTTAAGRTAHRASASGSTARIIGAPRYSAPPASSPVLSGTVQIAYRNIAIDPDTVRVRVGTTVRWTNHDPVDHNVTSESGPQRFASGNFSEGGGFSVKLTRPGVIHYECTIHPATMNGTIEVVR